MWFSHPRRRKVHALPEILFKFKIHRGTIFHIGVHCVYITNILFAGYSTPLLQLLSIYLLNLYRVRNKISCISLLSILHNNKISIFRQFDEHFRPSQPIHHLAVLFNFDAADSEFCRSHLDPILKIFPTKKSIKRINTPLLDICPNKVNNGILLYFGNLLQTPPKFSP